MKGPYTNPYGIWKVTTEGDEEGRSTKDLGVHEGYIDEIAFKLADQVFYSLRFTARRIDELGGAIPSLKKSVNVSLGFDAGIPSGKNAEHVQPLFEGRPVVVDNCNYHGAFTLHRELPEDEEARIKRDHTRAKLIAAGIDIEDVEDLVNNGS